MELSIKVIEIEKNIVNNTLSSWTAAGDVPIGWDVLNVKAVEGGNFGYLCKFLSLTSYIKQSFSFTQNAYDIYIYFTGTITIGYTVNGIFQANIATHSTVENSYEMLSVRIVLGSLNGIYITSPDFDNSYLDFVSIIPYDFPDNLTYSYINTNNILDIDTFSRHIENDLFSFVSDSITLSIFDDNNSDYTIIENMLQSGKLFRLDIEYFNGVKTYRIVLFCDPSSVSKTMENGRNIYSIEAFELASYFRINGWYLGTLKSTTDENTGEITNQEYNFLASGYNTIEEIIQVGIDEANKFFIAEYVPISTISKIVTVSSKTVSSTVNILGRIVDYYYNPIARTPYIISYSDNYQSIFELRFGGLFLVQQYSYDFFIRFDKTYEGSQDIMFKKYSIGGSNGSYNNSQHLMSYQYPNRFILAFSQVSLNPYGEYVFENISSDEYTPTQVNDVILQYMPQITDGEIVNNDILQYSFQLISNVYSLRIIGADGGTAYEESFNGAYISSGYSSIDYLAELLPSGIPNYFLRNTTFIDMLKDLSVIQNAFFYFNYTPSADTMQIVFQTRTYETATSQLTLDLNNASKYEETYDYIDYSDFETETFKDIVSMKRSLLAYFRNFYGNGLKIIKLTMNELLDISLGDIVTVEGNKYIIRSLETDIGYKDMTGMIQTPKMYLELMEVLLA